MAQGLPETNLVELLHERAARHPERMALRFLSDGDNVDLELSYAELHRRACALALLLREHARPGDRALLLYPSGPDYVTALLACFYAGVIAVPSYPPPSTQPKHVGRVLSIARDARPSLVLTKQTLVAPLSLLKGALEELSEVQLLGTDTATLPNAADYRLPDLCSDSLAMLQYTSGSTSAPKGVMLSHGCLMANERVIQRAFSIQPDDVIVSWLPLFHDMGLIGTLLQPLFSGVSAVLMPPQRFMERPRRWLEAISRHGGTVSGAPDFAYRLCLQRGEPSAGSTLDLSTWKLAFCGAEPVRAQTLRAFADKFAGVGFAAEALYPCYGMAEATLLVASEDRGSGVKTDAFHAQQLTQDRAVPTALGQTLVGCGSPWPEHELLIADPQSGDALPEQQVGEILLSGPSVAQGYWQNAEATAHSFVRRGERVFLRSGDLGFLYQGQLFVTGRAKDMLIVRGQNLYPQDLERAVEDLNEVVRQGRVVAFGLEILGEETIALVAEVSPRLRKLIDAQSVCRAISEIVAESCGESPSLIALLEPGGVPITSSGKLQRAACKQAWLDRTLPTFASYGAASSRSVSG